MDKYLILIKEIEETLKNLEATLKSKNYERGIIASDYLSMHNKMSELKWTLGDIKDSIKNLQEIDGENLFIHSFKMSIKSLVIGFKSSDWFMKTLIIVFLLALLSAAVVIPELALVLFGVTTVTILGFSCLLAVANYKFKKDNDMTALLSDEKRITEEIDELKKQAKEMKDREPILDKEIDELRKKIIFYESSLANLRHRRLQVLESLIPEKDINEAFEKEKEENKELRLTLKNIHQESLEAHHE